MHVRIRLVASLLPFQDVDTLYPATFMVPKTTSHSLKNGFQRFVQAQGEFGSQGPRVVESQVHLLRQTGDGKYCSIRQGYGSHGIYYTRMRQEARVIGKAARQHEMRRQGPTIPVEEYRLTFFRRRALSSLRRYVSGPLNPE